MLHRLQKFLSRLELLLGSVSLLLLLFLTLGQIAARNIFDTGIPAADNVSRILLLYVTFFGAALAVNYDRHIKVDLIAHCLPEYWKDLLFRPLQLFGMLICVLLCIASTRFWYDEWEYATRQEHWLVIMNLILPAGFGLLAIQFFVNMLAGQARMEPDDAC